jgi:hypothetical protein
MPSRSIPEVPDLALQPSAARSIPRARELAQLQRRKSIVLARRKSVVAARLHGAAFA